MTESIMEINEYVAISPLEAEPAGGYVATPMREAVSAARYAVWFGCLRRAHHRLDGRIFDDSTMRALVSLIERARPAEVAR